MDLTGWALIGGRAGTPGAIREPAQSATTPNVPAGDPRGEPTWCTAGVCGWAPEEPAEVEAGVPSVTLEDVASFLPSLPDGAMEPGPGVAVRRLPANFISGATEQIVSAPLLDRVAEVRFTPVGFAWETGDGGRVESSSAGKKWAQLRTREFTDTATSHRYQERGWYEVRPTVTFEAAYRFDGAGWTPVGVLDVPAPVINVRVVTVDTRLTRGTCLEFPDDPGCR